MNLSSMKKVIGTIALAAALSACVDSPEEPLAATDQNPLATSFEMLSQEQMFANDVERSEEFRWAALALRAGVTPSVHPGDERRQGGGLRRLRARGDVGVARRRRCGPPLYRTLIAWRRSGDILQVILVGLATRFGAGDSPVFDAVAGPRRVERVAGRRCERRLFRARREELVVARDQWGGEDRRTPATCLCPSPNDSRTAGRSDVPVHAIRARAERAVRAPRGAGTRARWTSTRAHASRHRAEPDGDGREADVQLHLAVEHWV